MDSLPYFWILSLAAAFLGLYRVLQMGRRDKRLPPGPPTIPILGNAHQIPVTGSYRKFKEWGDRYGKVFSLKVASDTIIVLNDRRAVHDLVDKKSTVFSDRPHDLPSQIALGGENFAFIDTNPMWRAQRKIASQNLAPRVLDDKVGPIYEAEIGQFLHDLLETPEEFYNHVKRTTASTTSIVLYGFRGPTFESFWANSVYKAMKLISLSMELGANPPVDQFPILKYIPERWYPWRTRVQNTYDTMTRIWGEARDRVDQRRRQGDERISLADKLLSGAQKLDYELNYNQFNNFLGALQQGGADTTSSSTLTSILLLAKHPQFQRKAQEELDRVCGIERVPEWADFKNLPYINCIVKEGLRLHPVLPLGVPHRVSRDEWYDGMLIPRNATIVIPAWSLHRSDYKDPEAYNPDRYLDHPRLAMDYAGSPDYQNRDHYSYGAGRRICVGIHLAERTQWRIVAKLLWAFDIEPAIDELSGEAIQVDADAFIDGIIRAPKPYRVKFRPRSEVHERIIRKNYEDSKEFLKAWE